MQTRGGIWGKGVAYSWRVRSKVGVPPGDGEGAAGEQERLAARPYPA